MQPPWTSGVFLIQSCTYSCAYREFGFSADVNHFVWGAWICAWYSLHMTTLYIFKNGVEADVHLYDNVKAKVCCFVRRIDKYRKNYTLLWNLQTIVSVCKQRAICWYIIGKYCLEVTDSRVLPKKKNYLSHTAY